MARPARFSLAWWKRQRRQQLRARAAAEASGKWGPPTLSEESKREIDALLRDLGGEG